MRGSRWTAVLICAAAGLLTAQERVAGGGTLLVTADKLAVQVAEREDGNGQPTGRLAAPPDSPGFGRTIATDGQTVAVGGGSAIFLYGKRGEAWLRSGSIQGGAADALAVSGETLAAGGGGRV